MNKKVKAYIDKQDEPKKTLLKKSRKLILEALPQCKEEFSWGVPVYDEGKFYLAAMKTRVHIGFAITGLSKEEIKELEDNELNERKNPEFPEDRLYYKKWINLTFSA